MATTPPDPRPGDSPEAAHPASAAPRADIETPLHRELDRQGDWLFRNRSWLPVPMLLGLLVAAYLDPPSGRWGVPDVWWELVCLFVGGLGMAWRIWIAGHVSSHTSGRNVHGQVAERVNTTGPYSLVRHPLYVGNFLMWLGVALFMRSALVLVLAVVYFWVVYERIMITEERFLKGKFGEEYDAWARRTPAFLPSFSGYTPSTLDFSWRTAARREYSGMFALVLSLAALKFASTLATGDSFIDDPLWRVLLPAAAALYFLLRALNRRTNLLRVEGR